MDFLYQLTLFNSIFVEPTFYYILTLLNTLGQDCRFPIKCESFVVHPSVPYRHYCNQRMAY